MVSLATGRESLSLDLLRQNDACAELANLTHDSPLHVASGRGLNEVVKELLKKGKVKLSNHGGKECP